MSINRQSEGKLLADGAVAELAGDVGVTDVTRRLREDVAIPSER